MYDLPVKILDKEELECHICGKKFIYPKSFKTHMDIHVLKLAPGEQITKIHGSRHKIVECIECKQAFPNIQRILEHCQTRHPILWHNLNSNQTIDLMSIEGLASLTLEELPVQLPFAKYSLSRSFYKCEFCDARFRTLHEVKYFKHLIEHDPVTGFTCAFCNYSAATLTKILNHRKESFSECVFLQSNQEIDVKGFYVCNICQGKFQDLEKLYEHRLVALHFFPRRNHNTNRGEIRCHLCKHRQENASNLMTHFKTRHMEEVKNIFDRGTKLRRNWDAEVFICDLCQKVFKKKAHVKQHLQFHMIEKPHRCNYDNCTKEFGTRADLNDHVYKAHEKARPFLCTFCNKRFMTGPVYYQHRLIHFNDRRYKCNICGDKFFRGSALKHHMYRHTDEKPFSCPVCTRDFRQKHDCKKHMIKVHKVDSSKVTVLKKVTVSERVKTCKIVSVSFKKISHTKKEINE